MESRLSEISTLWEEVQEAHSGSGKDADLARERMLQRYERAIRRYLELALRDPHAVNDLYQTFVFKFLKGDFRNADPTRGRFRALLARSLSNLVKDHHRARQRTPLPLHEQGLAQPDSGDDDHFMGVWRDVLVERAWEELAREQERTGRPLHTVLWIKYKEPKLTSAELAQSLGEQLGISVTTEAYRKKLCEARSRFKNFFLDEVQRTLTDQSFESLEDELQRLEMLEVCRQALYERYGRRDPRAGGADDADLHP